MNKNEERIREVDQRVKRVAELYNAKVPIKAIAADMVIKYDIACKDVQRARERGLIKYGRPLSGERAMRFRLRDAHNIRMGSMSEVLRGLDREQFEWLAREASKVGCDTIAEYVTELVQDAHAEDVDGAAGNG